MIKIDLKMNKKTALKVKRYAKLMESGIFKGVKQAMFFAEAKSKMSFLVGLYKSKIYSSGKAPVHPTKLTARTGHLRRSIQARVIRKKGLVVGSIGTNVFYGRRHELGIMGMKQRAFLLPAIRDNITKINDIINQEIKRQF